MPSRLESITQQRLEKLQRLRDSGIDPYPHRYRRTHTVQQAVALFERTERAGRLPQRRLALAGRIAASRDMGKACFVDIRDGTGKIQVYFRLDVLGAQSYSLAKELDLGDIIGVKGHLFRTRSGELTLEAQELHMLAKSLQPLPEKWHGLVDVEKRYRQRYLDLISNPQSREVFHKRSQIIAAMRRFLHDQGFIEVETPVLQPAAGGAAAQPFITHHHALDQDLYLRIATELHLKRLIIGGFDKVYEIGRIFRNEGISTKHNPEFTTLESYQAYADYHDVMRMVETMVSAIAQEVLGTTQVSFGEVTIELAPPWPRKSLREEIEERCGLDFLAYEDPASLRRAMLEIGVEVEETASPSHLVDKLISSLVEPNLMQPTFLLDYPVEMSPLAKRTPYNPRLVERFEAFAAGMEIANAFTELNDPLEQRERFQMQERWRTQLGDQEAERVDEDFLLALEYGMPPTGGLGVGIDRLVMLLTGQQSIREVILFPQLKSKPPF
ncbi:MAG TPA: lysine--tRNA ligase [Dehalococcoidia bacterium]|nr:lysine--tRNA ligase [Dehalococcoidia bacterium]